MSINSFPMLETQARFVMKRLAEAAADNAVKGVPRARFDLIPAGKRFYVRETRFLPTANPTAVSKQVIMHGNELLRHVQTPEGAAAAKAAAMPRVIHG